MGSASMLVTVPSETQVVTSGSVMESWMDVDAPDGRLTVVDGLRHLKLAALLVKQKQRHLRRIPGKMWLRSGSRRLPSRSWTRARTPTRVTRTAGRH
jgi:hypothetical protein